MRLNGSGCHLLKPNSVRLRPRPLLWLNSSSAFHGQTCPNSSPKSSSTQTVKQLLECYSQTVAALGENALLEDSKYWSQPLKEALGVQQDGGFPYQLSPLQQNKPQPVPAIDFTDSTGQSIANLFNN